MRVTVEEMDEKDEELREVIRTLWPIQANKMLDILVPPNDRTYTHRAGVINCHIVFI